MKKTLVLMLMAIIVAFIGCSKGEKTKVKMAKSVEEKMRLPERLKVIVDISNIRNAVVVYRNTNEVNPPSLEAMNLELHYSGEYTYDANTGVVKSKNYPDI